MAIQTAHQRHGFRVRVWRHRLDLGPIGLALIVASSNIVKPEVTIAAIVPSFIYLASWSVLAGIAYASGSRPADGPLRKLMTALPSSGGDDPGARRCPLGGARD